MEEEVVYKSTGLDEYTNKPYNERVQSIFIDEMEIENFEPGMHVELHYRNNNIQLLIPKISYDKTFIFNNFASKMKKDVTFFIRCKETSSDDDFKMIAFNFKTIRGGMRFGGFIRDVEHKMKIADEKEDRKEHEEFLAGAGAGAAASSSGGTRASITRFILG